MYFPQSGMYLLQKAIFKHVIEKEQKHGKIMLVFGSFFLWQSFEMAKNKIYKNFLLQYTPWGYIINLGTGGNYNGKETGMLLP